MGSSRLSDGGVTQPLGYVELWTKCNSVYWYCLCYCRSALVSIGGTSFLSLGCPLNNQSRIFGNVEVLVAGNLAVGIWERSNMEEESKLVHSCSIMRLRSVSSQSSSMTMCSVESQTLPASIFLKRKVHLDTAWIAYQCRWILSCPPYCQESTAYARVYGRP